MRYSYGAELRVFLPIFQAPLRFIYGINPHPFSDEKKGNFLFSIRQYVLRQCRVESEELRVRGSPRGK